jgi:putative endopeptidase
LYFQQLLATSVFYDYKADEAVNYGGIGAVIGHEISHGFDDRCKDYNADGNLIRLVDSRRFASFTALGGALADQYSALEPLPGTKKLMENLLWSTVGDLGGINAAYDGLQCI